MHSPTTKRRPVVLVRPAHPYLHRTHIATMLLDPWLPSVAHFSSLTESYDSNCLIATLVQEKREDLVEFEGQVEEDTVTAMRQAKSTGADKKREKELMKLVLAPLLTAESEH